MLVQDESKRDHVQLVSFAEEVDVYEVESFREWLPEYWYQVRPKCMPRLGLAKQ